MWGIEKLVVSSYLIINWINSAHALNPEHSTPGYGTWQTMNKVDATKERERQGKSSGNARWRYETS